MFPTKAEVLTESIFYDIKKITIYGADSVFRWRVDRVLYVGTVFLHKGVPLYQFRDKGKIYTLLR